MCNYNDMLFYTSITIIYNPISTGPGKRLAENLATRLKQTTYRAMPKIIATTHAGHAEELAYELAVASRRPLIIASSGDGGYHEVVNGVMAARAKGSEAVTGLLPAGNANDHHRNLHNQPIVQMIEGGEHHLVDLLHLKVTSAAGSWQRYAHSYAGVGLTPQVGHELNQVQLNPLNEKWIALRSFWRLKPVRLIVGGQIDNYDSLIVSNVPQMSKVLGLSKDAKLNDGKFEITRVPHKSKLELLGHLFKAATAGLEGSEHADQFAFQAVEPMMIQLDGEVKSLAANSRVEISLQPRALECVT